MRDENTIKAQLISELGELRQRIAELEASVSNCRQVEDALKKSEEKYRLISENIPVAVYSALPDEHSTNLFISGRIQELTGYSGEHFLEDPDLWLTIVHPEDRSYVWEKIEEHRRDKIPLDVEYRIITKDNVIKWLRDKATPMLDEHNQIIRIDGFMEDITERKRAEDQIRASLKEKEILLREIHHRTKNNMQVICGLLDLQSTQIDDEHVLQLFKDTENRIQSMALVHEKLYRSDLTTVDLKEYVEDLAYTLVRNYRVNLGEISLQLDIEMVHMSIDAAIPCGLMLNELITNALKYAFPDGRDGEINIVLHPIDEEEIELRVSDNGVGLPEGFDFRKTNTLGFQLVTTIAEQQFRGTVEIQKKDQGTEFLVRFQKPSYKKRM